LKHIARDLVLYVVVGVSLAAAAILWPFILPERLWPHLTRAWFFFIFFTLVLAIVLAKMYWPWRNSVKVWLLLALLMALHIIGYSILLHFAPQLPAISYVFTMPLEVMAINLVTKGSLNVLPRNLKL
jgi:hypothetical protein